MAEAKGVGAGGGGGGAGRKRKASEQEKEGAEEQSATLEKLLTCGVCCELMEPPIYQCIHGHTLCKSCMDRIVHEPPLRRLCPTCRAKLSLQRSRNLVADTLAESFLYPCPHEGCSERRKLSARAEHAAACPNRPRSAVCHFPLHRSHGEFCPWRGGSLEEFWTHLREHHPTMPVTSVQPGCTEVTQQIISLQTPCLRYECLWAFAINWSGVALLGNVWFSGTSSYHFALRVAQAPGDSRKFQCGVKVSGTSSEIAWKDVAPPATARVSTLQDEGRCLSLPKALVERLNTAGSGEEHLFKLRLVLSFEVVP